jgi:hypothetical protein
LSLAEFAVVPLGIIDLKVGTLKTDGGFAVLRSMLSPAALVWTARTLQPPVDG